MRLSLCLQYREREAIRLASCLVKGAGSNETVFVFTVQGTGGDQTGLMISKGSRKQ